MQNRVDVKSTRFMCDVPSKEVYRVLKFIPQFSCWKVNNFQLFVIASCAKTHEIKCYFLNTPTNIAELPRAAKMPDIRLMVPCRWHALSAVHRALLREVFSNYLIETYGEENWTDPTVYKDPYPCD